MTRCVFQPELLLTSQNWLEKLLLPAMAGTHPATPAIWDGHNSHVGTRVFFTHSAGVDDHFSPAQLGDADHNTGYSWFISLETLETLDPCPFNGL